MSTMQKGLRKLLQFVVSAAMFYTVECIFGMGTQFAIAIITDCTSNFGSAQCHNAGLPSNFHRRFWRHVLLALCASQEPWT